MTEPLPLVPATCTTAGSPSCGRPRRSSRRSILPSERSMILGCRLERRSRTGPLFGSTFGRSGRWQRAVLRRCRGRFVRQAMRRRRVAKKVENADQTVAQRSTTYHHVDHTVLEQVLGSQKPFCHTFPSGLLEDSIVVRCVQCGLWNEFVLV